MSHCAAQWPLPEVRLIHADEAERLAAFVRSAARICAQVLATAGFAAAMWLVLAGPGFLDGRSSTVDHKPQRVATWAAR